MQRAIYDIGHCQSNTAVEFWKDRRTYVFDDYPTVETAAKQPTAQSDLLPRPLQLTAYPDSSFAGTGNRYSRTAIYSTAAAVRRPR